MTKLLILVGKVTVTTKDKDGITVLHQAAVAGDLEICNILVEEGAEVDAIDVNHITPLMLAASERNVNFIATLLHHAFNKGINIANYLNMADNEGNTALHLAVTKRKIEPAEYLLSRGANVLAVKNNGSSALHIAAVNGCHDIAAMLIRYGAFLQAGDEDGLTALHWAALFNRTKTMVLLMEKGCLPDTCAEGNMTPLMCAAWKGHSEAAALLLRYQANISAQNYDSKTCLHWAIENEHLEFVQMLLGNGGKCLLTSTDWADQTALHYAAECGDIEIVKCLLSFGANGNAKDVNEKSPLHVAAQYGKLSCVKLLLQVSPSLLNDDNIDGMTPLLLASRYNYPHVARYLLKSGADICSRNDSNLSSLALASCYGNIQVMEVLIEHNANVSAQDYGKNTPLHLCCVHGQTDAAILLLKSSADICITNVNDRTPLDLAIQYERQDIACEILSDEDWRDVMSFRDSDGYTPMRGLIEKLPEAAKLVLDRCIHRSHDDPLHPDLQVTFDLRYIDPGPDDITTKAKNNRYFALNTMIAHDRESLLSHQLCQIILKRKWVDFARFLYYFNFLLYCIFLITLTAYVLKLITDPDFVDWPNHGCHYIGNHSQFMDRRRHFSSPAFAFLQMYLLVYTLLALCKEMYELYHRKLQYFLDVKNLSDLFTFGSTLCFILPPFQVPCTSQWKGGVLGVFWAWINFILYLQRVDFFGLYVIMFWTTLQSLLKAMAVYGLFIFAFSLSFRITFASLEPFKTGVDSFLTTFSMTLGELNKNEIFETDFFMFKNISYFLFFVFLFLMPMVLINLTIGISVGDIEAIRQKASIKRLSMQVDLIYSMENKFPFKMQRKFHISSMTIMPNKHKKSALYGWVRRDILGTSPSAFIDTSLGKGKDGQSDSRCLHNSENHCQSLMMKALNKQMKILCQLAEISGLNVDDVDAMNSRHEKR